MLLLDHAYKSQLLAGAPSKISVTWTTFDDVGNSTVEYGEGGQFDRSVMAAVSKFMDGGKKSSVRYIHRALIEDVQAGHRYSEDFVVLL